MDLMLSKGYRNSKDRAPAILTNAYGAQHRPIHHDATMTHLAPERIHLHKGRYSKLSGPPPLQNLIQGLAGPTHLRRGDLKAAERLHYLFDTARRNALNVHLSKRHLQRLLRQKRRFQAGGAEVPLTTTNLRNRDTDLA